MFAFYFDFKSDWKSGTVTPFNFFLMHKGKERYSPRDEIKLLGRFLDRFACIRDFSEESLREEALRAYSENIENPIALRESFW